MLGLLEGGRRFGSVGASRLITFVVQAAAYLALWLVGHLTVQTAAFSAMAGQFSAMGLALFAVWHEFHPSWKPGWKAWRDAMHYGMRGYPGTVADFATLRMDELLLGGSGFKHCYWASILSLFVFLKSRRFLPVQLATQ